MFLVDCNVFWSFLLVVTAQQLHWVTYFVNAVASCGGIGRSSHMNSRLNISDEGFTSTRIFSYPVEHQRLHIARHPINVARSICTHPRILHLLRNVVNSVFVSQTLKIADSDEEYLIKVRAKLESILGFGRCADGQTCRQYWYGHWCQHCRDK